MRNPALIRPCRRILLTLATALLAVPALVASDATPSHLAKALEQYRLGRYEQARSLLLEVLARNSRDAAALHLLGLAETSLEEPAQARRHLEASVALAPGEPTFAVNLARLLLRQGDKIDARQTLEHSVEVAPYAESYELLGLICLQEDASEQALEDFRQSLALAPTRISARYYLGLTQQSLGRFDAALDSFAAVLDNAPDDFFTHLQCAKAHLIRGDLAQAETHLRAAAKQDPNSAAVALLWSRLYLAAGNLEQALQSGNKAVELAPGDAQAHYQLGQVLARLHRTADARAQQRLFEKYRVSAETLVENWRRGDR